MDKLVYIDKGLHTRLKHAAADLDISVKALVTESVELRLDHLEEIGTVTPWESIQALGPQKKVGK